MRETKTGRDRAADLPKRLKTILFHIFHIVSVLDELYATAGQRVCVCSFSLLPHCLQPEWALFHGDSHRAERDRHVGSLGHYGFKALFTDGPFGVRGLALTVGNVSSKLLLFQHASDGWPTV